MEPFGLLDGLPEEVLAAARDWERHVVEVETGLAPDAKPSAEPRPGYDPTWQVSGHILPGGKQRAGLLPLQVPLQVTSNPSTSLTGSAWEGMSGAVVFAADAHDGDQTAVGSSARTTGRRESRP